MTWKYNKILFNYIINQNYIIKKDIETSNILFIKWKYFEMKCKYFLAFTIDNCEIITWSCDNPYIDQKTQYLSKIIKTKLNNQHKFNVDLLNNIKNIIQTNFVITYDDQKYKFIWCLIGNSKNLKHFYVITEIIYI